MIAICAALLVILVASIYANIRFVKKLLALRDIIEECLDVIDEKHVKMSEILARPLFYDSPEVRRVVDDIRATRSALHRIAYELDNSFDGDIDEHGDVGSEKN